MPWPAKPTKRIATATRSKNLFDRRKEEAEVASLERVSFADVIESILAVYDHVIGLDERTGEKRYQTETRQGRMKARPESSCWTLPPPAALLHLRDRRCGSALCARPQYSPGRPRHSRPFSVKPGRCSSQECPASVLVLVIVIVIEKECARPEDPASERAQHRSISSRYFPPGAHRAPPRASTADRRCR